MSKAVLKPLIRRARRRRIPKNTKSGIYSVGKYITLHRAIKCIGALLLSGTSLIGGARPLGFAMFAACFGGGEGYICGIFAILGLLIRGASFTTIGKYIIAAVVFSLIYEQFLPQRLHNKVVCAVTYSL